MRWRRREGGFFDAGLLPGRHEAREIFGIGEEGEDDVDGIGEPLFGVKGVAHAGGLLCLSCSSNRSWRGGFARLVVCAELITRRC